MIADEKRRKVAHALRQINNVVDDEPMSHTIAHEATILGMIRDATIGLDGNVFQRLADLIDRPIGRPFIPDAMEGYVFCPRCGAEIGEYGVPNYCHKCGLAISNGRVVERCS